MTRHLCVSDDGRAYTVLQFQEFEYSSSQSDPNAKILGDIRLALPNGRPVHFVDDETFRIVSTGKIVRKRQPTAV